MTELVLRQPVTMIGRSLRMSRRNVDSLLTSLMLPVMMMLLFVYLFGGAIQTGTKYVTYVVPGVLLLCAGFGASMTAVSVSHDMAEGIIDRFRSMDIRGTAVIAGHVVASVARNLVSTGLVLGIAFAIGFAAFVFAYLIPLVVANVIAMSFIMTNHCLSPATPSTNDPLVNSLSVTLPRPLAWLSLGFGYHVEHHVFPTISTRFAPLVRDALRAQFGDQYQAMPLPHALYRLYTTGRVYKDDHTLIDPRTGETFPTLGARR